MIHHTMLVAFDQAIPESALQQYVADVEDVMQRSGAIEAFAARPHLPAADEAEIPAMAATVIIQMTLADRAALDRAFAAPGLEDVIRTWQTRHPYRVAFANHEPLD